MKRYFFVSLVMTFVLFACNKNNPQDSTNGENYTNLNGEAVKIIEADRYQKKSENLHFVAMRFATGNVGYVTQEDSAIYVSGSGAIIDILLVTESVDENKVPIAGTYNVGSDDTPFTALNNEHYFGIVQFLPAVYNVNDGNVSTAISYNSGSVKVVKESQEYKITIVLKCSDGTTREYEYNGQISVIDKSQAGNVDAITIQQGEAITIISGYSEWLSVSFSPNDQTDNIIFESSDQTIVNISGSSNTSCFIHAHKEGTCNVTARCVHNNCSATIVVTVVTLSSVQYEFCDLYLMQSTDEMPDEEYLIYRLRQYRGDDISDGGDASLTKVVDNTKNFPDAGTWLYRYTADNGYEYGIFADSVISRRVWLLSTEAFFYNDGNEFGVRGFAPLIEFKFSFYVDNKYYYCLGQFHIESDATATDTIRKPGVPARPMPSIIQASRFNQAGYLSYCTDLLNGSNVNWIDYGIFGNGDARLKAAYPDYGDPRMFDFFGCVNGGYINFESPDYNSSAWLKAEDYDISATVYENPMAHCLATQTTTDPSTGQVVEQLVVPYQMAESKNINYTKGQSQESTIRRELAIPKHRLEKQIKITNTIGAVLRMYLYSQSKRWY